MKNRSELRDIIIKILYQTYIYDNFNEKYDISEIIKEFLDAKNEFVFNTIDGIKTHEKDIIILANKYLKNWTIDRISKVDKAILSLGIYELKYTDTPNIVCINEAIELSKKYSDTEVTKMINATLDNIYHNEIKED